MTMKQNDVVDLHKHPSHDLLAKPLYHSVDASRNQLKDSLLRSMLMQNIKAMMSSSILMLVPFLFQVAASTSGTCSIWLTSCLELTL
jgi:hypothetical protein